MQATKIKKYDIYKDSGIEWVGEIPTTWQKVRLRFLCNIQTGDKDTVNKVDDGKYPFYVRSPIVERINTYTFDGEAILTAGDGVGAGKVFHYVTGKFDYHQRVYNLHNFKRIFGKFLYLYLKENFYKEIEKSNAKSTVDSIRLPMLLDFPVVFPVDTVEQQVIADYLDKKCGEIDKVVETEKAVIEKLKEYKQSIITESVTKGLDKSVPLKDSGIEWIGKIPQHWNINRGKNILSLLKREIKDDMDVITCFRDGEVTLRSNRREEGFTFADKEIGYQGIEIGDLVIHGMDGFAGAIGISDSYGKGSPVLNVCNLKYNYSAKYFCYYLRMLATQNIFIALATGIRERSCDLRWNKIANLLFIVPNEKEQQQIAEYLDKKCSEIDKAITGKEQLIEKLTEYKKSLIYECVTGKRKVV